jgi:hypothetical protein
MCVQFDDDCALHGCRGFDHKARASTVKKTGEALMHS